MSNVCVFVKGNGGLPDAWMDSNGKPCYPAPGYSNGQGVAQSPAPSGYITDPNPPVRNGNSTSQLPMVNSSGQPISGTGGGGLTKPALIFIGGIAVILFLGGTKFAPVVIAFLAAALVFWGLNPFKKGG